MKNCFVKSVILIFGFLLLFAGCPNNSENQIKVDEVNIDFASDKEMKLKVSSIDDGGICTLIFEAPAGYKSYNWYLNGILEDEKSNKFSIKTNDLDLYYGTIDYEYKNGFYTVSVIVKDAKGELNSASEFFLIDNSEMI